MHYIKCCNVSISIYHLLDMTDQCFFDLTPVLFKFHKERSGNGTAKARNNKEKRKFVKGELLILIHFNESYMKF